MKLTARPQTVRQLAEKFGVRKLTIYRWLARLKTEGVSLYRTRVREGKKGPRSWAYALLGKDVRHG